MKFACSYNVGSQLKILTLGMAVNRRISLQFISNMSVIDSTHYADNNTHSTHQTSYARLYPVVFYLLRALAWQQL